MNMNRLCLVALIGLPAVGKTTICQHLMQMESLPFNILHLCYDNLINFNSEIPSQYKKQRESLLSTLEKIIQNFKNTKNLPTDLQAIKSQYKNYQRNDIVILCDDNHYYRSMRYKLFQLAREYGVGYCQIYLKCTVQLALERNSLRSDSTKVPHAVVAQMNNRFEIPNAIENIWEKNTLFLQNLDLYENNCNEIISYVVQFLNKPPHPLQISVSKSTTIQSKVHELDLLIRIRINKLMSSEHQNKKLFANKLNDKRKEILEVFKSNMNEKLQGVSDLNKYVEMLT